MDRVTFGKFIANTRRDLGMTQQALADQLHVTDKAVSKWERGLCYPDLLLIEKLAAALGLTVDELMACQKHREELAPADCSKTEMRSLLEIASESQRRQKRRLWPLAGLLVLSIILLAGLVFLFTATNIHDSRGVTFAGKKADGDGNFVYVEMDGRLLCLHCPDQQMFDTIEANKRRTYRIEYRWNYFTYQGTLESCQETISNHLGTAMDTVGSEIGIDSLLGIDCVVKSTKDVYPDPEREGKHLYTFAFYYYGDGKDYYMETQMPKFHLVTVENCRSTVQADYDEDGIVELFVLTKYEEEPYMVYDVEDGVICGRFVDEVPSNIAEKLKKWAF